jgi:hypothetical protein
MRARQAARVDNTAKALRKYAESIGFVVVVLNTVVDCLLVWGSRVIITDWKSPGGSLTPAQATLVAKGVPIRFISRTEQLDALRVELQA